MGDRRKRGQLENLENPEKLLSFQAQMPKKINNINIDRLCIDRTNIAGCVWDEARRNDDAQGDC